MLVTVNIVICQADSYVGNCKILLSAILTLMLVTVNIVLCQADSYVGNYKYCYLPG